MVLTTFIKYLLHTIDLQSENPWDNKAVYMLYTELFTGTVAQYVMLEYFPLDKVCVVQDEMMAAVLRLFFLFLFQVSSKCSCTLPS